MSDSVKHAFSHINAWVFDLDNTLYPPHVDLFSQVDKRMTRFIEQHLGLTTKEANDLRLHYYHHHGTTLRGLMDDHGVFPHAFLDYVHDIDHSVLAVDPDLRKALAALPGRKFVLTNGSQQHAKNVTAALEIAELFDDMIGIEALGFLPKPQAPAYERFLALTGLHAAQAVLFEDLPQNLLVPHALGMKTVLVGTTDSPQPFWPHVDYYTPDLSRFLQQLIDCDCA